jgi:hypothetical protein
MYDRIVTIDKAPLFVLYRPLKQTLSPKSREIVGRTKGMFTWLPVGGITIFW